ncbi:MAG: YfhO family protein [Aggregatilineales bacterium]
MNQPLTKRLLRPDVLAICFLILLWWIFFWRLFTPVDVDRTMLVEGDFSGQFVAFGAYQFERFSAGEIPLWNPYNNGGLPFIADTQAAVFYPPRLITIALTNVLGGSWNYNTLQMEMVAHVLLYSLLMYLFLRRLTLDINIELSVIGSLAGAIIAAYGGFMSGYPPLQLALLEAAIWLPLALLGILEATRYSNFQWRWLALSGFALGVSWMAGHPQTSWFATYVLVAYLGYRIYAQNRHWRIFLVGTGLVGIITFGVVAVQFIPGIEYSLLTMRSGLSFVDKGNGFPFQDITQFIFPGIVSIYSPLFIGVSGLILVVIAIYGKVRDYVFWAVVAVVALSLSFGANSAVFHVLYNLAPGLNQFRGQERAAYLVSVAFAVLAGQGLTYLLVTANNQAQTQKIRRMLIGLLAFSGTITALIFVLWFGDMEFYGYVIGPVFFSTIIIAFVLFVIYQLGAQTSTRWGYIFLILIAFELFTVNIDNSNFEPARSNPIATPSLVETILQDQQDEAMPFRVDGNFFGLYGNYASLYGVQDIRGISPLFLDGSHAIIQRELPSEVAWELFAVRYVLLGTDTIPTDAENIGTQTYRGERVDLHRIDSPRPVALLMYDYEILDSDEFARALLADPNFDERTTIILDEAPPIEITAHDSITENVENSVEFLSFEPERYEISVETTENAILSLSQVDYPGWKAKIDGEPSDLIRAYGALTALPISAGSHTIELYFDPISFKVGAVLSLVTWIGLSILAIWSIIISRQAHDKS